MFAIAFIDLDGTLLTSDLSITTETLAVITEIENAGHQIVLCTGRPYQSVVTLLSKHPSFKARYIITSSGGCLADLKLEAAECVGSFAPEALGALARFGHQQGLATVYYTPTRTLITAPNAQTYLEISRSLVTPDVVADVLGYDVVKILFIGSAGEIVAKRTLVEERFGTAFDIQAHITYPEYLEISPSGVSKAVAAQRLLTRLAIPWSKVIAIGDGTNDVPLLKLAGVAVVMSNASDSTKAIAHVIAPNNDDNGVAYALRWLLLNDVASLARLSIKRPIRDDLTGSFDPKIRPDIS